jgi:hypothetical protein
MALKAATFFFGALMLGALVGGFAQLTELGRTPTYVLAGGLLGGLIAGMLYWIVWGLVPPLQDRRIVHSHEPAVVADEGEHRVPASYVEIIRVDIRRDEHVLRSVAPRKVATGRAIFSRTKRIDRVNVGVGIHHGFDPTTKQPA